MVNRKKKLESLQDRLQSIRRELEDLKAFRDTPQRRKFEGQLIGEQSFVKNEIRKIQSTNEARERARQVRIILSNKNRSSKMKTSWRYFRAIQENYFPDRSLKEIRSLFSRRRRGLETDIPDVAWRNPSP